MIHGFWGVGKERWGRECLSKASMRSILCVCILIAVVVVEGVNSNTVTKLVFNLQRGQAR